MAKNTNPTSSRSARNPGDESAVYKIMGAILLLAVSVYLMRMVANNYSTIDGLDAIYPITLVFAIVFGALAVASLAALIFLKAGWVRKVCPYVLAVSVLYALTGLLLRVYWMDYVAALTFLHVAVYCLYIVYQLYKAEFFLVSLLTIVAGGTFYRYSHGIGANFACIALGALLLVLIAAGGYIAFNAAKHNGAFVLGQKNYPLFGKHFNPLALYITSALWAVCLIACLIFGAAFAYYCMFAALAFELIAAVYYTFQLK